MRRVLSFTVCTKSPGKILTPPCLTFGVVRGDVTWGQSWDPPPPCHPPAVRPEVSSPLCQSSFTVPLKLELMLLCAGLFGITLCWNYEMLSGAFPARVLST